MRRAKTPDLAVGLDVGTTKICAIVAEPAARGVLNIIGVGTAPSRGLRRGIVVNIDSTVEAIKSAVGEAEQMAGVEISGVYAGVAGGPVRGVNSRGVVPITRQHHEGSEADGGRGIQAARAAHPPPDRGNIHVPPPSLLVHDGGDHISNDIAIGLRTPTADAEDIKKRYGCALTALVPAEETVDVPAVGGRKPRQLSRQLLSEIIQPRVEEIFTLVARELARAGFQDAATAGVVVTGGTSIMEGIPELAEGIFDQPVRRGVPIGVGGLADAIESPIYATAVGLALYGRHSRAPGESGSAAGATPMGRLMRLVTGLLGDIF